MAYLISVIIPTYNDGKYIRYAIDSVLQQNLNDFEVIVIDDGSTDNTQEVLSSYIKSNKIRYFYQKNKGVSAARNRGILEARGQYLCFLDADDIYLPGALTNRLSLLTNNLSFGFTDYFVIKDEKFVNGYHNLKPCLLKSGLFSFYSSYKTSPKKYILPSHILVNFYFNHPKIHIGTIIVDRLFLMSNKIFFNEELLINEDHNFIWKLLLNMRNNFVAISENPTYLYHTFCASWFKNIKFSNLITSYDKLIPIWLQFFSKPDIAKRLYGFYWDYFIKAPFFIKLKLFKKILFFDPLNTKYWKSFFGIIFHKILLSFSI